jgi:hypothetical protein
VVGNSKATQYKRLINREIESLSKHPWEVLVKEHTFPLVTSDQDYSLPADYRFLIPSTQWNRDNQRGLVWITSQEWQFFKGWTTVNGLNMRARIRGGEFEFEQTIESGDNGKTIAFEYVSKYPVETSGGTAKQKFTLDDDVSLIDEELVTLGLIWRIKKAKGLDWQPDMMEYSHQVKLAKARSGGSRNVRFGRVTMQHLGVNTPDGNYPS